MSVIIPVYNAAGTLNQCLDSLFSQTYDNLELVFVDDCSDDGSGDIVCSFAADHGRDDIQVKLIRHEINSGVAAARNTAMDNATGKYVCSVDADDWLETDAVRELVDIAESNVADIVGCDWYLSFNRNERYMAQRHFETPLEALKNMMAGVMRWNLWLFMVRKSLYDDNQIRFVPGMNMGEDMLVTMRLFLAARNVEHVAKPFYHYRQVNESSVSKVFSDTRIAEVSENVTRVESVIHDSQYRKELLEYVDYLKQFIKLPLLMTNDVHQYKRWNAWFTESDKSILKNKMVPLRTRLVEYAALKQWYFLLKLYHIFVYKFIYGLIYR